MTEPTDAGSEAESSGADTEVGAGSLWLLRGALGITVVVVVGMLVWTAATLFGGNDDAGDETIADLLATTTTEGVEGEAADEGDDAQEDADEPADTDTDAGGGEASIDAAQAELDAFVDEAMVFIEAARGRSFLERPVVELVDVDTMTRIVLDDIESELAADPEAAEEGLAFARALGFFAPDDGYLDVYEVFVSSGVLGVYFPASDQLLVRFDGELSLLAKATVVHELVHAFDDQHFDLDRDELAAEGDVGWTFSAAAEGSASYVEDLWRATLSDDDASSLLAEELSVDVGDIFSLDFGFLIYQTSVYDLGQTWLERRIATEGIAAIDDALINAAASSEVVIEPLDAPNLEVVAVPYPDVDGDVLWQGTGGQALIAALTFASDVDGSASSGWGGDAITVYLDGDGAECLRWDIATDSVADQGELLDGLSGWAADVGADISEVGDLVRIDRCA